MKIKEKGFTLVELMIVVTIIGVIAAVGMPIFLRAKMNANEGATIANIRNINAAQGLFESSKSVDTDQDGKGEYGSLGELTGLYLRTNFDGEGGGPVSPGQNPASLSAGLRPTSLVTAAAPGGACIKSGYVIQLFLPGPVTDNATFTDITAAVDSNLGETHYRIYAWPINFNNTGLRCFAASETFDVIIASNENAGVAVYSGVNQGPLASAAVAGVADDATFNEPFVLGAATNDGQLWNASGN